MLVLLAQESEENGFDETILDKSTGIKWLFLFQRIHNKLTFRQRIANALHLIAFQMTKWLSKTPEVELNKLPTIDNVLGRLLCTMAKEPQDRVNVTLTFTARQEKWKFLFLQVTD